MRKLAVLAGVANYQANHDLPTLITPQQDAADLGKILESDEANGAAGFEALTLLDPQRQQLAAALEKLFVNGSNSDDMVLFFFSGHGKLSSDGGLHLCAADTEIDALESTTISLTWLSKRIIDKTRAAQIVIILDCCFSGAAQDSFKGDLPSLLQANLGQGRGKYLMTSSTSIQPSRELPGDRHSLFSKWLIEGLKSGAADLNNDGVISVDELYRYVETGVRNECPGQQPKNWGFDITPGQVEIRRVKCPDDSATATQPSSAGDVESHPYCPVVRDALHEGRIIPFIGDGVFGSGPLSAFALVAALAGRASEKVDKRYPLATAAEFLWLMYDSDREDLLRRFRKILDEQSQQYGSALTATHQMTLAMPPPSLLISATYDWILEDYLDRQNQPYVLVAHVMNSNSDRDIGKILVLRTGDHPRAEIVSSDELLLDELHDRIIYKLVGSPYLNEIALRYLQPRRTSLDTVVLTESDHMAFLSRLKNQSTKVPEAMSVFFKSRPLLFLGYNLDIWHYRLVGHIFSKSGYVETKRRNYAVRQPTSPIEQEFWKQIVPMDCMFQCDCETFSLAIARTKS